MKRTAFLLLLMLCIQRLTAQSDYITNVYGRQATLLNGKWNAVCDPYDRGLKKKIYENRKARGRNDFYEYAFEGGLRLNVPGDWNSQAAELKYYEGTVWYGRALPAVPAEGRRQYLCFTGVSNRCRVWLNGQCIGSHEVAFTGFQVEVTGQLRPDGDNYLVVEVNNRRLPDAIPAMSFDWWNYGGITRDVLLVSVPDVFIGEYRIQLDRHRPDLIRAFVQMSKAGSGPVKLSIPELKKTVTMIPDGEGRATACFRVKGLERWSPQRPRRYRVSLTCGSDSVSDDIGFRIIETRGTEVLLNGQPLFLRCVSFHEEIPQRQGRAFSEGDARYLLSEAEALGANMVRLAHYQQNEHIVREAERRGIMVWQEIPVWQAIDFDNAATLERARQMLTETIRRDYNRCADCFWSVANETQQSPSRNAFIRSLLNTGRSIDSTRLYSAAFNTVKCSKEGVFTLDDELTADLDVVGINRYMGWYSSWQHRPADYIWRVAEGKPLFISEFGG